MVRIEATPAASVTTTPAVASSTAATTAAPVSLLVGILVVWLLWLPIRRWPVDQAAMLKMRGAGIGLMIDAVNGSSEGASKGHWCGSIAELPSACAVSAAL